MTQKRVHRSTQAEYAPRSRRNSDKEAREHRAAHRLGPRDQDAARFSSSFLPNLIEQNAPLKTNTSLVLMYGPFQAEMGAESRQGVASWISECIRKHGLPSLVRFDHRHRAQVFRRDQFQPWLEPLLRQNAS